MLSRTPLTIEKPPAKPESNAALDDLRHVGGPGIAVGDAKASGVSDKPKRSSIQRSSIPAAAEPPSNVDLSVIASLQPTFQWRPMGAPPSGAYSDKPVMRHEIISLLRRFQFVMLHADRLAVAAASGDALPSGGHTVLDGDYGQCRAIMSRAMSLRELPTGAAPLLPLGTRPEDYAEASTSSSSGELWVREKAEQCCRRERFTRAILFWRYCSRGT
jgi:hypothetical protein